MKKAQLLEHDSDVSDVYQVDIDDFEPSEEQISFDAFKGESQDDLIGILKVYRIPNADEITNLYTAKTRYLFNVPIDQFGYEGLLDFIREKYGSGAYRLIGTIPGKKGSRLNKIVEIEAPMKNEPTKSTDSPPRSESPSTMLTAFAAMMKESQERTAELVRSLVQNQVPKDSMAQMGTMIGLMTQIKDFFGGGGKSEPVSLLAEIEKHKAIAGLFGSGAETNESDVWVKLAEQFAPAIVDAMGVGQGMPQLSGPDTPAIVSGAPAPGAAVVATAPGAGVAALRPIDTALRPIKTEPNKESSEMVNLKTQAAALFGAAKNGIAPEKMANTILNLTPEDKIEDLYAFMNSESCVQTFVDAYPPLEAYREWLAKVQVNILGELVQDDFREPGVEETLHPGELTGADALSPEHQARAGLFDDKAESEKELTDIENKPKIVESEKATPKKVKAKAKSKSKASKKGATQSSKPDN